MQYENLETEPKYLLGKYIKSTGLYFLHFAAFFVYREAFEMLNDEGVLITPVLMLCNFQHFIRNFFLLDNIT